MLPKRFADRVEVAAVRIEAGELEPGVSADSSRRLAGRVLGRRELGKLTFLDLVDRSGRIQLFCEEPVLGELDLDLGDIVGVSGKAMKTKRGEPSLRVEEIELLAKIRLPLPDVYHGLTDVETRFRKRYLDLLVNEESRRDAITRSRMVAAIRRALDEQGSWRSRRRSCSHATAAPSLVPS